MLFFQAPIELAKQCAVSVELLADGVDEDRLPRGAVGEQVGVGRGFGIDQLSKDHGDLAAPERRVERRTGTRTAAPSHFYIRVNDYCEYTELSIP